METETEFARSWLQAVQEAGVPGRFELGKSVHLVRLDSEPQAHFDGQKRYGMYLEDPTTRAEHIAALVQSVRDSSRASVPPPELDRLVVVIKTRHWLDGVGMAKEPHLSLPDGLVAVLAEDLGESTRYLRSRDLTSIDRPLFELFSQGVQNLRTIAPIREDDLGGVFMLTSGGDYEASLMLDQNLIASFERRLGGAVIFAIPTTDVFMIGRFDQAAVEKMARGIAGGLDPEQGGDPKRALSPNLYAYRDGAPVAVAAVERIQGQIHVSAVD